MHEEEEKRTKSTIRGKNDGTRNVNKHNDFITLQHKDYGYDDYEDLFHYTIISTTRIHYIPNATASKHGYSFSLEDGAETQSNG